jgi:peptidoglycan/LPS O-acetylase OafA/YrhL
MQYVPALDGVRAIAIVMVLLFHAKAPWANAGFFGVDVFFVLSGYLITRLLVDEHNETGSIELIKCYLRRLRRLYPALLLFITVYLVVGPLFWPKYAITSHLRDALLSVLYLQDYTITFDLYPHVLRHMWSLSVEEHFYLFWPLLLLAVLRMARPWSIAVLICMYVGATLWRLWSVNLLGAEFWQVYFRFDTHASGLFLGGVLGYLRLRLPSYYALLGLVGLAILTVFFEFRNITTARYIFTLAELCAGAVVLSQPNWLGFMPIAWIGRMSYGLYLWHYLIMRIMQNYGMSWEEKFCAGLLGGLALAAFSYYTIESRFRTSRNFATTHPSSRLLHQAPLK